MAMFIRPALYAFGFLLFFAPAAISQEGTSVSNRDYLDCITTANNYAALARVGIRVGRLRPNFGQDADDAMALAASWVDDYLDRPEASAGTLESELRTGVARISDRIEIAGFSDAYRETLVSYVQCKRKLD